MKVEIVCGGDGPRLACGCHHNMHDLVLRSGESWIHIDGHGDEYAATEDGDYCLPVCTPCHGAVGPYSAAWFSPEHKSWRCSGCLRHHLHDRIRELDPRWYDENIWPVLYGHI